MKQRRWKRLTPDEQATINADRVTKNRGVELHEPKDFRIIGLKSDVAENARVLSYGWGTAMCGRPVHEWYFYFRCIPLGSGLFRLTHYVFEECHPALNSPNTMGFGLFMPELVKPFTTTVVERNDLLDDALERLEEMSRSEN